MKLDFLCFVRFVFRYKFDPTGFETGNGDTLKSQTLCINLILWIFKLDKEQKYLNSTTYEWQDDNNVRFRCIVNHIEREVHKRGRTTTVTTPPSRDAIITFYSDKNLNEKMIFKNLKVEEYYSNLDIESVKKDLESIESLNNDSNNIFTNSDDDKSTQEDV